MDKETKEKYERYFKAFTKSDPDWKEYLTDSTYYELADFYSDETGQPFDDEFGYPDDVYAFASYCWFHLIDVIPDIDGEVMIKELEGGMMLHLVINVTRSVFHYEIEPNQKERYLTISLSASRHDDKRILSIPMGEGFNLVNYMASTSQSKGKLIIDLVPLKTLVGGKVRNVKAKDITEECRR